MGDAVTVRGNDRCSCSQRQPASPYMARPVSTIICLSHDHDTVGWIGNSRAEAPATNPRCTGLMLNPAGKDRTEERQGLVIHRARIATKRENSNTVGFDSATCTLHAPFSPIHGKTTLLPSPKQQATICPPCFSASDCTRNTAQGVPRCNKVEPAPNAAVRT